MKIKLVVITLVLGAVFSTAANAEGYIGVSVSDNSYDYSNLDNSTGNKIFGGYFITDNVFIEAAHVNLGETKTDDTTPSEGFEASGWAGYVGYRAMEPSGWAFFGKLGIYSFDVDGFINTTKVAQESGDGLAWSIGVSYAFNKMFAIRAELEQFVDVEDFADDKSITGGSIGVELRF